MSYLGKFEIPARRAPVVVLIESIYRMSGEEKIESGTSPECRYGKLPRIPLNGTFTALHNISADCADFIKARDVRNLSMLTGLHTRLGSIEESGLPSRELDGSLV